MDYNRINGRIGQVLGPFNAGEDLLSKGGKIDEATAETYKCQLLKLGIQATPGTIVQINGVNIKISKSGVYELDYTVIVKSLVFPNGADEETMIDFVY